MHDPAAVKERFREARRGTERLVARWTPEDLACPAAGGPSAAWRLGHTTWFVERYVLEREPDFAGAFAEPAVVSRPGVGEIMEWRRRVDRAALGVPEVDRLGAAAALEELHQEALAASMLHLFSLNPLEPAPGSVLDEPLEEPPGATPPLRFLDAGGETGDLGRNRDLLAEGPETPRHRRTVARFQLGSRLITNAEYREFVEDGGYRDRRLWLRDGFEAREREGWEAPLYWRGEGEEFTFAGSEPMVATAPVAHLSYYEADAFARWRQCRLPTEFEWESVAARSAPEAAHLMGDAWQWTTSAFEPYPGYRRLAAADSALFGDFSPGRMVVRGGSRLTPEASRRATTRRALPPGLRWHRTGIRLARDG